MTVQALKIDFSPYLSPITAFTANQTNGDIPFEVQFVNQTTGDVTLYTWNFGDGNTSNDEHPIHIYTDAGVYTVSLLSAGPGGESLITKIDYITASIPVPIADFEATPLSGILPLIVQFTNLSQNPISSVRWYFGNGHQSINNSPKYAYLDAGTYTVTLEVTGPGGSDSIIKTNYITVIYSPIADFEIIDIDNNPLTIQFHDQSIGDIDSYLWDFGDGEISTEQNPIHEYINIGTYIVSLTVTKGAVSNTKILNDLITIIDDAPIAKFDSDKTEGALPLTVQFYDYSFGNISTYNWNFGDSNTSNDHEPTHTYQSAGEYTVSLTVTGPGGTDTSTRLEYIIVVEEAIADFEGNNLSGVAPLTVNFTNLSTGSIDEYSWGFGNSTYSTVMHPIAIYNLPGIYTVELEVAGTGGIDTEIKSNYIEVYEIIEADFSSSSVNTVAPATITFLDESTGIVDTYAWDFGNGETSIEENPSVTYDSPGLYSVTLTVTGPAGTDSETKSNFILITSPVSAFFVSNITTGNIPLEIHFEDQSTGSIDNYLWNFGDGNSSTEQNPNHIYTSEGRFDISLTVSNFYNSDTYVRSNYINISYSSDSVNFASDIQNISVNDTINFTNLSVGDFYQYIWSFGDGLYSIDNYDSHIYSEVGIYSVELKAISFTGIISELKENYIYVSPIANFTYNQENEYTPSTIQFINQSIGEVHTYLWDFGDGNISIEENPSHIYSQNGLYTVSLTVTNTTYFLSDQYVNTNVIYVKAISPICDFIADNTSGIIPLTVNFTNLSTGIIDIYLWDFGDGNTSAEENPIHTYNNVGLYTVTLIVTGPDDNAIKIKQEYINVHYEIPNALFESDITQGDRPLTVNFTNLSTGIIDTYSWDFGDGNTSTEENPSNIYNIGGRYTVSLTVIGPGGTDSYTQYQFISVFPLTQLKSDFIANITIGISPLIVQFTETCIGDIVSYLWDFGDGNTSTEESPSHIYNSIGQYSVSLLVSDENQNNDLEHKHNYINVIYELPEADFIYSPESGETPLTVKFKNKSKGTITTYFWDFDDDSFTNEENPTHTFTSYGRYVVTLTVTGPGGTSEKECSIAALRSVDCVLKRPDNFSTFHIDRDWFRRYRDDIE